MSTRNGDKARANRERKKKEVRRKRIQELRKAPPSNTTKTVEPAPTNSDDRIVSSHLRRLPEDKDAPGQGGPGLEIVVQQAAKEPQVAG
jgi:hypothetical protein